MAGAPEPIAPGAPPVPDAPLPPDQTTSVVRRDDGAGNSSEVVAVASNRSWAGALFASGDMSVDSLIVCMICSVIAYWLLCGFMVWRGSNIDPLTLGGGFAAMMVAFAGGKTARDRWSQQGG